MTPNVRRGRCVNFGECPKADAKEIIEVPPGADFVCPVDGTELKPLNRPSSPMTAVPILLGVGLVILLLVGLGAYLVISSMQPRSQANLPQPTPTPAAMPNPHPVTSASSPGSLSARAASPTQVLLSWDESSSGVKSIKVERCRTADQDFVQVAELTDDVQAYTDTGLAPGTEYEYRLRASDVNGDSPYSKPVLVSTPDEPKPTAAPVVVLAATPSPIPTSLPTLPPPEIPVLFRMHGSTTVGDQLAKEFAKGFFTSQGAHNIQEIPGKVAGDYEIEAELPGETSLKEIEVSAHGSAGAFTDLLSGTCDIGMASREVKPDEARKLADAGLGNMLSRACENIVALDGVAIIVNQSNGVQKLSIDQLQQIYAGKITNWSEVGGTPGSIDLYAREEGSGTLDTFKSIVMKTVPLASSATRISDSDELSNAISKDVGGIGFVGLGSVHDNKALQIADSGAEAFYPTVFTVRKGDYALTRRLYLYIPANSSNSIAKQFISYTLSDDAQNLVDKVGFIGLNVPAPVVPPLPSDAPEAYKQLVSGAKELDVTIRFISGSSVLDNLAFRDMIRIMRRLGSPENQGGQVILIGFADSTGSPDANLDLSKKRAEAVSQEFQAQGLEPALVTGFGQAVPVASNDTPEGREKNRRVEIWIKK